MIQHNMPMMVDQNNGYNTGYANMNPPTQMRRRVPAYLVREYGDITPQEIPRDGTFAVFIREDFAEVYILTMTLNGVQGYNYQLANSNQNNADPMAVIMEKLDRIEQSISRPQRNNRPKKPRPKQEVNENGNG